MLSNEDILTIIQKSESESPNESDDEEEEDSQGLYQPATVREDDKYLGGKFKKVL